MKLYMCIYLELYDILKGKNVVVKSVYLITEYIVLQLCTPTGAYHRDVSVRDDKGKG
jgi:hypothetical protein